VEVFMLTCAPRTRSWHPLLRQLYYYPFFGRQDWSL